MARLNNKLAIPVLAATALFVLSACLGGDPVPTPTPVDRGPTTPTATPTPEPTPPPTPTPTPTPQPPTVTRVEAEGAVLDAISSCTDGVAFSLDQSSPLLLFFDTSFQESSRSWRTEVATADFTVTFGTWKVNEGGRLQAIPDDRIAEKIASRDLECAFPSVLLESDPTPPRFGLVSTEELAAVKVWSGIYSCSQDFPELESFTAIPATANKWFVEGRSDVTSYGLWSVDATTGEVQPEDERAEQVFASCDASVTTLTGEQAAIRVWVATYDCFNPDPPARGQFSASQEAPHRWVVEGRGAEMYGLWLVETDTGKISGLDFEARRIRDDNCFQEFL